MITIWRKTDRIPVKIGGVNFKLAPLTLHQKQSILACTKLVSGKEIIDELQMGILTLKYSIKEVSGLQTVEGSEWSPSFDDNGNLDDDSIDVIMQLDEKEKLAQVCASFLNGIKDPGLDGVEVELKGGGLEAKK